ncbi:MAG: glycosyltransferase [Thermoleophilia bacterium]
MNNKSGKLKIGLVSPYAWTSRWGINRHIAGLAEYLRLAGHDVSVIVPAEERDTLRQEKRRARMQRRLPDSPARTETPRGPGPALRLLKISGTFRMPYSESMANLALPQEVTLQLDRLLAEERFDILHLHEPYPPSLSFTALRYAHSPAVATFHTSGERFLSYQLMRPVVERFFSRLDGRICTSQNTRRIVSSYFPGDYEVIGVGVDDERFRPCEDGSRGRPLVVFAAWSEPRKSFALLARVLRLLPTDVPAFDLAIVGGEDIIWRDNLIVPRRLRDRIHGEGDVDQDQVAGLYSRAGILCAPYAATGLDVSVLEAMSSGAAIIIPARGGFKDLVSESVGGLLLDHPYSYNLAAGLVDLLRDAGLRDRLSDGAIARAALQTWAKTGPAIETVYREAHTRRQRPAVGVGAIASVAPVDTIAADLHIHTSYSHDCSTTPARLLAACEELGLEAIAVTDHNTITGAREVERLAPAHIHVIIGEEIKTSEGEIIGLYLQEEIPAGLTAEETIRRIKEQGGLVYVPHPFDPLHLTPTYEFLASHAADIDIIEVYNPRITFTSFNEKARRLARKYDIPAGAGSDCHVIEGLGTAMLSLGRFTTPDELLASLRAADIIRSRKHPLYLHSLKLLKNGRSASK